MRLIDADTLEIELESAGHLSVYLENLIDSLPTIDAVPVVRCKDCIDYEPELGTNLGWCPVCSFVRWDDDFCSYGERKETDND